MQTGRPPRGMEQRTRDVLARLTHETDVWVASADAGGTPYLVPLWFVRHDDALWLATRPATPTARNLRAVRRVRLALGDTLDVVLVDGDAEVLTCAEVPAAAAEAFVAKTGWDPRKEGREHVWIRVRPRSVEARNGEHEMRGRRVMTDGVWAVAAARAGADGTAVREAGPAVR
ncbi:pyridoxamine 5'-phosphate oxidase family protein [Streptomyces sp. UH6]|uniref:pyridoxamine 5'-phosphate oxidase family protein n=1 Tax=Streptomyces sp. UH6 TaxID=2748379 RepID=UPI0015D4D845|nr:pyridoxamine 5'-phosphate oxidase family protein [Streptomyces sp. UH6]NYV77013.1 pyridoxamine 5'-phosphate oxidase family protein [Streptomyces sp. UH6]